MIKPVLFILKFVVYVCLVLSVSGCVGTAKEASVNGNEGPAVIEITALVQFGEPTRFENLLLAADLLNKKLEKDGALYRVKVSGQVICSQDKGDLHQEIIDRHANHTSYDIYALEHGNIGWLADQELILPVNETKGMENYRDLYPPLWEAVRWRSEIWAIPQDSEARIIFYHKDILRKLGWSEANIESLPQEVARGNFTNGDMIEVAQNAVDQKLCNWGIVHRPVSGPDFLMSAKLIGAELYDEKQEKLVFHRSKILELLQSYRDLSIRYHITPKDMTEYDRDRVYQMFWEKESLFWEGGTWNIYDFVEESKKPFEDLMDDVGVMLYPAYEKDQAPITLTNPFVYVISSDTKHKEALLELLNEVANPELQSRHATTTYHLPITRRGSQSETFKSNPFLKSNTYMLDYAIILPNHPGIKVYEHLLFEAISETQTGRMAPEEAVQVLETQLKIEEGTELIIINSTFAPKITK